MAKAEEIKVTPVEDVIEAKPVVAKPKYVKVRPIESGKKHIGGVWYTFEADKDIEVTEDAKRVLLDARAIYLS